MGRRSCGSTPSGGPRRLDLPGRVVAVDEVSLAGLEAEAERTEAGGLRLLGLSIEPPARPKETGPPAPVIPPPAAGEAPAPVRAEAVARKGAPRVRLAEPPLVTIGKFDFELRRLAVRQTGAAAAAPVTAALRLASPGPIELLGDAPETRPPVKLDITGKAEPIVGASGWGSRPAPSPRAGPEGRRPRRGDPGRGLLAALPS